MKKPAKYLLVFVLLLFVILVYTYYPALNIITGYSSKNMASGLFLANRDQTSLAEEDNGFFPISLASYTVNSKEKSVSSSIFGLMKRKAVYKEGLGSILINEDYNPDKNFKVPNRNIGKIDSIYPFGKLIYRDTVFKEINYEQLKIAVDKAFDSDAEKEQQTRSVLILYQGKIVAEKYADGFDQKTLMHGWSMTKSLTSTVYGVLQRQGKININSPSEIKAWQDDDRKNITISDLLHMNSGLEWEEEYFDISDVTKMLYMESDMGKSQIKNRSVGKKDSLWNYSSGTTNILSGPILRKQFIGHQEYLDFWYRELIDRIGMHSMVVETDLAGNYIGSSYAWATTRDWAKFGLLYLNEGNWNGDQVLDSSWVKYASTPTNTSNGRYGAQFWLNAGAYHPDVPLDMYSSNGFKGQYVFIIPSRELVIVRTGLISDPRFNINEFLKNILSSIKE